MNTIRKKRSDRFKKALQVLANVIVDDDDEKTIEREKQMFSKFVCDTNRSRATQTSLMASFVISQTSLNETINRKSKGKSRHKNSVDHDNSFYDVTVPRLSLDTFRSYFGMKRSTVEVLINRLTPVVDSYPHSRRVSMEKRTLLTLWVLCNQETFRTVGKRFGMAQGNCHYLFINMCTAICKLAQDVIVWPNSERQKTIAYEFCSRYGFPNTVGAIGSCQITIKLPDFNALSFFNRKGVPCIVLQAVCDHRLCFVDIYAGQAGSVNFGSVYRSSPVCEKLNDIVLHDLHLVGDNGFPLLGTLQTPFRDKGRLTERQKLYNTIHKPVRNVIQLAFSKLKGTFKRLKFLDMQRIDLIVKIVLTACTLHNLLIENEGEEEPYDFAQHEETGLEQSYQNSFSDLNETGSQKRNNITDCLNQV